ncbi:MAG: hemolysin family protein [Treponema sp.]
MPVSLLLAMITVLLICAAFFSGAETAVTAISRAEYRKLKKMPEKNAQRLAYLVEIKEKIVTATLIGTNFVNTFNASLTTAFTLTVFGAKAVPAATLCIALLIIITAEIFPKAAAAEHPVTFGMYAALPLLVIYRLLLPLIAFFSMLSKAVLHFFSTAEAQQPATLKKKDFQLLVKIAQADGAVAAGEEKLLENALILQHLKLRSIMTPRTAIVSVTVHDSWRQIVKQFQTSTFSRLPVCNEERTCITGIVHYKDILFNLNSEHPMPLSAVIRPAVFVPDSASVFSAVKIMNNQRQNMVIAVNEHGTVTGLITMDDITAAVFSHLHDEYGIAKRNPMQCVSMTGDHLVHIPGDMSLEDCNDLLHTAFYSHYYDTIGGFLLEQYGYLPAVPASIKCGHITFHITEIVNRRITAVTADIRPIGNL